LSSSSRTRWSVSTARVSGSTGDGSRDPVLNDPASLRKCRLIHRLARENSWRARKIQAELEKLGFTLSLATVSRYLPKTASDHGQRQRWKTFLRDHKDGIVGMDSFVVPTLRFRLLYVWFVVNHGRRKIVHFNVTTNPTAPKQARLRSLEKKRGQDRMRCSGR
jgi:hypothetical protein